MFIPIIGFYPTRAITRIGAAIISDTFKAEPSYSYVFLQSFTSFVYLTLVDRKKL